MPLTCRIDVKAPSCNRRESKAGQKGPHSSGFKVLRHFRSRFIYCYQLHSTSRGLSTRLQLLDALSFKPYDNVSKVGITPILQMKKSKVERQVTFPCPHHQEAGSQRQKNSYVLTPSSILFTLLIILPSRNSRREMVRVKYHQYCALETV